eukprot:Lithocolla_globosa_v1_NODE_3037_length_1785_cov_10.353179.p2 type:complete len:101 gc:universal NODE_3037_length_1785_cov_10.353179:1241-939(-)
MTGSVVMSGAARSAPPRYRTTQNTHTHNRFYYPDHSAHMQEQSFNQSGKENDKGDNQSTFDKSRENKQTWCAYRFYRLTRDTCVLPLTWEQERTKKIVLW